MEIVLRCLDDTYALARFLAEALRHCPTVRALLLRGPLGSGKTTFACALVRALPNGQEAETGSPSFTLCNQYPTQPPVLHCDLYRGTAMPPDELLEELANSAVLTIVEWAEYLPLSEIPNEFLDISFNPCDKNTLLTVRGHGSGADALLQTLVNATRKWTAP
ncbi:MAG: tRNA threonylcarbamoyladenosine biosynthesis protein TsaE [Candidatus Desulfovibrio kirbyi]|uniref:tRNA threonylcarbamoyladenosine biosynthesis protein TsaE n=1 Tax=Candidatus Desulfovibrio kirbyi TaxID=2696086 RepID=A0A6L2R6S5_9BACT|nr:MAG: tRNA threonylcarbamoyladenosine biosynthesis protein TsaE [Candidatus Desulfovibrio kirbyi]